MKIFLKNAEKIDAEIAQVEGKATARLLSAADIAEAITRCERDPACTLISKPDRRGMRLQVNTSEMMSAAYAKKSRTAACTLAILEYFAGGWAVVSIERKDYYATSPLRREIKNLTPKQQEMVSRRIMGRYGMIFD